MAKRNNKSAILTEIKESAHIALPLVASGVIHSLGSFSATIMMARLSHIALATGALVGGIYSTILVFMFGLLSAIGVIVAQNHGAEKPRNIAIVSVQGLYVAILMAIVLAIALWFTPLILKETGQNPQVIALSIPYLHASILSLSSLGILAAIEQFLIGIGRTKLILVVSLIEVPLEIIASYAFVFGKFGLPATGIVGIRYGFASIFVLAIIFYGIIIKFEKGCKKFPIFKLLGDIHWNYIGEIFRVGIPTALMYIVEVAFLMMISFFMGIISVNALDAHRIVNQYSGVSFMIIWGLTQAVMVRVGNAAGRKDREGIKIAAYAGQVLSLGIMLLIAIFYWLLPKIAISVDIDLNDLHNHKIIRLAISFFAIMALGQIFDSVRFIASGALRGLKDTKVPLIISIIVFWFIGLPIAYWVTFYLHYGHGTALWGGNAIAALLGALLLWIRFQTLSRKVDLDELLLIK